MGKVGVRSGWHATSRRPIRRGYSRGERPRVQASADDAGGPGPDAIHWLRGPEAGRLDRYCPGVRKAVSSVYEVLRTARRELICNHLEHRAATTVRTGPGWEAEGMCDRSSG